MLAYLRNPYKGTVYTDRAQAIEHAAPMNGSMSPGSPDRDGYWTPTSGNEIL